MMHRPKRHHPNLPHALISAPMAMQWIMFGLVMIAASLVYLTAANWRLLPDEVRLIINPLMLLLCALLSARASAMWMSALHTVCGLMAGLSLAVIGQVYQTGADSLWLFVLWSLLIVPWLYRVNDAAFVLLAVVSQIALWLSMDQWRGLDDSVYPIVAILGLVGLWASVGRRRVTYLVALGISGWAVLAAIGIYDWRSLGFVEFLLLMMAIFAPWALAVWARRYEQAGSLAIAVVGGALAVFIAVLGLLQVESPIGIALMSQLWFLVAANVAYRQFGQKIPYLQPMLLAVGGWLTSLFALIWLVADVLMGFASAWAAMAYAIVILVMGMAMLIKAGRRAYTRHLGYALVAIGLGLSYYAIIERWDVNSLWPLIALQSVVVGLLWRMRVHWLYLLMQALFWYGLLVTQSFDVMAANDQPTLMTYGLYALGFLPALWVDRDAWLERHHLDVRFIELWVLTLAVGWSLYFGLLDGELRGVSVPAAGLMASVLLLIGLGLRLSILPMASMLILMPLGVMAGFGLMGLLAVILVLSMAVVRRDYVSYALSVCVGIGLLWLMYYQLSLVFLVKFITILVTGVLMIMMGVALDKRAIR